MNDKIKPRCMRLTMDKTGLVPYGVLGTALPRAKELPKPRPPKEMGPAVPSAEGSTQNAQGALTRFARNWETTLPI